MPELNTETFEVRYISGVQVSMTDDGETVFAVSWVECPVLHTKRISMRAAASRETAERLCHDLMELLGIREEAPHILPSPLPPSH
ncbi:MAG TPA: hypothetical protein VHK26_08820 [Methyloceanibacter sp.]|jgi:hypothetical protein|nr:hypothetical protein [Methyloceanibacter sp.]